MDVYSGPFLTEDGFINTQVEVEKDEVRCFQEGGDEGKKAIMIPAFFNAHAHIGDSVVKKPPTGSLEDIVGPEGKKHKILAEKSIEEKVKAMKNFLEEMHSYGIRYFIDFREKGIKGLRCIKKALDAVEVEISPIIMSRPKKRKYDSWELNQILSMADGIGLSAHRDWDEIQISKIASTTKSQNKPFALHCSENVREPIEEILELDVHHLVHMVEANSSDMEMCADEKIPVVICPRSNMFFGKIPDIPRMIETGLSLSLGTDNAMISNGNMFREMETAYRLARINGEVDPLEILMMCTWNPRNDLIIDPNNYEEDHLLILEYKDGDPASKVVLDHSPKDIIKVVRWKDGKV